jgi:hypothetical protein
MTTTTTITTTLTTREAFAQVEALRWALAAKYAADSPDLFMAHCYGTVLAILEAALVDPAYALRAIARHVSEQEGT